ncbi:Ig-like domain-containing protein [Halovenus sp. HT40]|uniref:Ig-like domain-containing protein n=1 Tax=Halovenus sp. HT40 TaxID=3126691 RepID=UPI00300EBAF0
MRFLSDNRAQSIQVGAVLLFGILIILLSTWQAFVIPDQNEGIEFNHNEDVQQQMTELRTTVNSMPDSATTRSATVDLGVRYPSRTIFRNPPPVSGTLETRGTTEPGVNISIANAQAADTEAVGTGDFWDGTTRSYSSGAIQYRPSYNQYDNAPTTIYEQSVLYNRFEREGTQLPITDQTIVQDGRLSLVALNGSLSETRVDSTSVDLEPLSTQTSQVEIEQTGSAPITIEFPTRMAESRWQELIPSQHTVTTVDGAFPDSERSLLRIELDESRETYQLQLAKVGVGTGTTVPGSAYLSGLSGNGTEVERGDSVELTLEVRDDFNRPLSGEEVYADAAEGTIDTSGTTNSNGEVTFTYETDSTVPTGPNEIDFSIDGPIEAGYDDSSPTNLTMVVDVFTTTTDSGQQAYEVRWLSPADEPGTENCDETSCTLNYTVAQSLDLDMETVPTADGVSTEFGVENRNIGVVSPNVVQTDPDGTATTTFEPQANGTVKVYTWGGGSGDVIDVTVEKFGVTQAGGLSNARITDLVPAAGSQMQIVEFTLEEELPSDETVTVTLDEAQGESPIQVDYGSVNKVISGSGSASINANSDTATLTYTAGGSDTAGTTVKIRVGSLPVGSLSDQNSPYSIEFTRSDSGDSITDPFEVARGSGDAQLQDVSVSDIETTNNEDQTISFTPTTDLGADEIVTVELNEPEQGSVDYGDASVSTVSTGSAGKNSNNGNVYITYTAPDTGVSAGSVVDITLSGVSATAQDSYDVGLSRADGDTAVTQFNVTDPTFQQLQAVESAGVNDGSQLTYTVENVGSSQVTVENFSIDATGVANNVRINNGDSPELSIQRATQSGEANRAGNGNDDRFEADGRTYDFVADSIDATGQYAEIAADDDDVTVDFRGFDEQLSNVQFTDQANADITVTLGLSDGRVQTYYFAEG